MTPRDRDPDPYAVLGVDPRAPDQEVRAAYHRLVKLHHPDHNGGSTESARRFEEVQAAYAKVRELRSQAPEGRASRGSGASGTQTPRPGPPPDPDLEARLAEMERELREAHLARERAREAARKAAREAAPKTTARPTDEELGYVKTDDSFSKILADAGEQLSERLGEAREEFSERVTEATESPRAKRVSDLIDELAAKLTGESSSRPPRAKP